jgi:hypothetical protein
MYTENRPNFNFIEGASMTPSLRRLAFSLVLGSALVGGVALGAAPTSAQSCDPSYPDLCLAAYPDLDCGDIGYSLTVLHDPSITAYDPHGFDADFDGIGCESW